MLGWLWQGLVTDGTSDALKGAWRRITRNEITIISPREAEVVEPERRHASGDHAYRVRGQLKRKTAKQEIWVLIEDENTGRIWPQERAEYVSQEWSALVWGMKKPRAKILAVVADPAAHDLFSYYLKHGPKTNWAPIHRLPSGVTNTAIVRVQVR